MAKHLLLYHMDSVTAVVPVYAFPSALSLPPVLLFF